MPRATSSLAILAFLQLYLVAHIQKKVIGYFILFPKGKDHNFLFYP
jgi:hypothetical protein